MKPLRPEASDGEAPGPPPGDDECPPPDTIAGLIEGWLSAGERERVEAHIDRCPDCRRCVSELARSAAKQGIAGLDVATRPESAVRAETGWAAAMSDGAVLPLDRGTALGRYVVDGVLGAGAMGVVYVAYDPELDRKVALKLLRPALGEGPGEGERLLREARAMARLAHPNVVAVHDVGVHGGQPFLAMEFVEGITLSSWLRREARPVREVLRALVHAGRGLAAAHAAGIVHRDFKPDNVLCDSHGRVRVTDFGLARAARAPGGADGAKGLAAGAGPLASATRTGAAVGTPAYMAPEQLRGEVADEKSDQFAFCVALYEALYRRRPFEASSWAGLASAIAAGRVREPPAGAGVPSRVHKALLRGLQADPRKRHPSMDRLLAAIVGERLMRFRRQALAVGAVFALLAAATGYRVAGGAKAGPTCGGAERGLSGIWDVARKDTVRAAFLATGKPFAPDAWRGVERALDGYARELAAARVEACEATHVRGEQSAALLDLRMACLDERLRDLGALTEVFARADARVTTKAVGAAQSLAPIAPCGDARALRARAGPPPDPPKAAVLGALHEDLARAKALERAGLSREALPIVERAVRDAATPEGRAVRAQALFRQGHVQLAMGDAPGAEATLFHAVAAADVVGDDATRAEAWVRLMSAANDQAKPDAATVFDEQARAALERLGGDATIDAWRQIFLATALRNRGQFGEARLEYESALALCERAFGPGSQAEASALGGLGNLYAALGDYEAAAGMLRRSAEITEALNGPLHPQVASHLSDLGGVLAEQLQFADAVAHHERAVAIVEGALGPEATELWTYLSNLGEALHDQGLDDRALAPLQRSLSLGERRFGPAFSRMVHPLAALGEAHLTLGDRPHAITILERAVQMRIEPFDAKALARAQFALARALVEAGRDPRRARTLAEAARDAYRASAASPLDARTARRIEQWLDQHPKG